MTVGVRGGAGAGRAITVLMRSVLPTERTRHRPVFVVRWAAALGGIMAALIAAC